MKADTPAMAAPSKQSEYFTAHMTPCVTSCLQISNHNLSRSCSDPIQGVYIRNEPKQFSFLTFIDFFEIFCTKPNPNKFFLN